MGYSLRGCKESDRTERLTHSLSFRVFVYVRRRRRDRRGETADPASLDTQETAGMETPFLSVLYSCLTKCF